MQHATTAWDSGRFNRRVTTFAHAMIIISLAVVWLILLKGVLQPFFIALGLYFVLKPGSDYLSTNGFPVILSYLRRTGFEPSTAQTAMWYTSHPPWPLEEKEAV
ncbi:hypothetical protein N9D18_00205 [bacterium]|nr:hypothetical protein [bacterium]